MDEPPPRLHARLRRRSSSPANARRRRRARRTSLPDIPPTGELDRRLEQPGVYFGEDLGGLRRRRHEGRRAGADRRAATTEETQYTGDGRRRRCRASCARPRSRCASATGTSSSPGQLTDESRILYKRDIKERVETAAPFLRFDADPYPVVRRQAASCGCIDAYTISDRYPYSQSIEPEQPARRQRARHRLQLRAQLGEGDGRRVQRHDHVLRRSTTERTRSSRRTARRSPSCSATSSEMPRRAARALALPRRHVPGPDRAVHAVPHDRRERVLPQAVPVGHRAAARSADGDSRDDRDDESRQRRRPQHDAGSIEHADRTAVPDDAAPGRDAAGVRAQRRSCRAAKPNQLSAFMVARTDGEQLRQARRLRDPDNAGRAVARAGRDVDRVRSGRSAGSSRCSTSAVPSVDPRQRAADPDRRHDRLRRGRSTSRARAKRQFPRLRFVAVDVRRQRGAGRLRRRARRLTHACDQALQALLSAERRRPERHR